MTQFIRVYSDEKTFTPEETFALIRALWDDDDDDVQWQGKQGSDWDCYSEA